MSRTKKGVASRGARAPDDGRLCPKKLGLLWPVKTCLCAGSNSRRLGVASMTRLWVTATPHYRGLIAVRQSACHALRLRYPRDDGLRRQCLFRGLPSQSPVDGHLRPSQGAYPWTPRPICTGARAPPCAPRRGAEPEHRPNSIERPRSKRKKSRAGVATPARAQRASGGYRLVSVPQQLSGGDDALRNLHQFLVLAHDAGPQQTPGLAQGLARGGTLGAQPPQVGRVIGVPGNGEGPFWPWGDQDTATHPTVGAGGAYRRGRGHGGHPCKTVPKPAGLGSIRGKWTG